MSCPKCGAESADPPAELHCAECATEGWELDADAQTQAALDARHGRCPFCHRALVSEQHEIEALRREWDRLNGLRLDERDHAYALYGALTQLRDSLSPMEWHHTAANVCRAVEAALDGYAAKEARCNNRGNDLSESQGT